MVASASSLKARWNALFRFDNLLTVAILTYAAAVTALFAARLMPLNTAVFLLVAPTSILVASARPGWFVTFLVALPPGVIEFMPPRRLSILIGVVLLAQLVVRGRLYLDWRSGLYPLVLITLAGHLFHAHLGEAPLALNGELMKFIVYYVLLAAMAYNAARVGELDLRWVANGIIAGILLTVLLETMGFGAASDPLGFESSVFVRSYFAYLPVMGLSIVLWRLLDRHKDEASGWHPILLSIFAAMILFSFVRAAWVSALIIVLVLSKRARKWRYWAIVPLAALIVWTVPTVRQEVASSSGGDIGEAVASREITTGRWELWTGLWVLSVPALPWGNGFGYTWSITSERIFGISGVFQSGESKFIYPHNDFLFMLVEFGIVGAGMLIIFWAHLFTAMRGLRRRADEATRRAVLPLTGVLVTAFIVASVDNLFTIRPIAERFFVTAGCVFGTYAAVRKNPRSPRSLQSGHPQGALGLTDGTPEATP